MKSVYEKIVCPRHPNLGIITSDPSEKLTDTIVVRHLLGKVGMPAKEGA